jgi:AraC-like DNA-binding protein
MDIMQTTHGYGQIHFCTQSARESVPELSSLEVVTEFLDAAFRMWDDDSTQAKSCVKIAAAMLRGFTDEPLIAAEHGTTRSRTPVLALWQTRNVKAFIDTSLDTTIRLRDCASKARLSASYFARAFKATFGTTVCRYIRQRRITRAQQLMLLSDQPLSQIALDCGFADQAHYCRVFRDVVGMSPKTWRRWKMNLAPGERRRDDGAAGTMRRSGHQGPVVANRSERC